MIRNNMTYEPIIYDIWEHYEKIQQYRKWLISERVNLVKSIKASMLDYEILLTRMVLMKLEKQMKIEFVGDILNLSIVQKETFHYIEKPTYAKTTLSASKDQEDEGRLLPCRWPDFQPSFFRLQ